ncbi:hypothetical protein JW877_10380 [bacterium]|nr:hypothetical protein [bacterium]
MTLSVKEYAIKIYSKIESAPSTIEVENIFNNAITNLKNKNFSEAQIEQFKELLREQASLIKLGQVNEQTLKNQEKAKELLKKDK